MPKRPRIKPTITSLYILCFGLSIFFLSNTPTQAEIVRSEPVICTMDAMMCPDGSYVGRSGPKCEFVCPSPENNLSTTTKTQISTSSLPTDKTNSTTTNDSLAPETPKDINPPTANPTLDKPLSSESQKRITNLAANVSNRLDAVVARLFNIIGRLENRIILLKQQGLSTTEAEAKLRQATAPLAKAKNLLSSIDSQVYEAVTAEKPYTSWQHVKNRYQEIVSLINESYLNLKETLQILKEITETQEPQITNSYSSVDETLSE